MNYYVSIPIWGLVSIEIVSAILLYMTMVMGMVAKAIWDQTEQGGIRPTAENFVRPILVSPIAFSAFWGPMYVQQEGGGISLTTALYAFQIGFMWQHILEKRQGSKKYQANRNV